MGWPAGLKLNTNLDRFLGELFLWMIFVWEGRDCISFGLLMLNKLAGIQQSEPYIKIMIKVAGYAGFAGFTLLTGIICDAFALSTLHITCFYSAAAKLYHWQLNVLYSLFNLFRGNPVPSLDSKNLTNHRKEVQRAQNSCGLMRL